MADDFFNHLSPRTLALVHVLLSESLAQPADLRQQVEHYIARIDALPEDSAADAELAHAVANGCLQLLDTLEGDVSESHRRFVQLACRYFVEEDDEDGDLESVLGFDDDAEVLNLVADQLGYSELKVTGLPGQKG